MSADVLAGPLVFETHLVAPVIGIEIGSPRARIVGGAGPEGGGIDVDDLAVEVPDLAIARGLQGGVGQVADLGEGPVDLEWRHVADHVVQR